MHFKTFNVEINFSLYLHNLFNKTILVISSYLPLIQGIVFCVPLETEGVIWTYKHQQPKVNF